MKLNIETEEVEFKASTSQLNRAIEALGAMLNKSGHGKVYFGVLDDGTVVGQDVGNKTIKDISEAISQKILPHIVPTITPLNIDDKIVIMVEATGYDKPYTANGLYLIRSGSENKKLEPEQLKEIVFTNSSELIISMESFNQELTFMQLKQLYIMKGLTINDDTFSKNTGLLCRNGHYNVLGDLLSDNNNYSIKVVRFAGKDKSKLMTRNEYGYKCLLLAMQQAQDYIYSLNETRVQVDEHFMRKEIKLFDEMCFKEAWTNACLHSQWSKMIPPVIYIYDDRMEIVSTGGLALDYPLEDFYRGVSHTINKQLQKIMGQLGIVEQTGHGVSEIIKAYGKEAFTVTPSHIMVTFKFPFNISSNGFVFNDYTSIQREIIQTFINQPSATIKEVASLLNMSTSRISEIIKELKDMDILERKGSNKDGYWLVKKDN